MIYLRAALCALAGAAILLLFIWQDRKRMREIYDRTSRQTLDRYRKSATEVFDESYEELRTAFLSTMCGMMKYGRFVPVEPHVCGFCNVPETECDCFDGELLSDAGLSRVQAEMMRRPGYKAETVKAWAAFVRQLRDKKGEETSA